MLSNLRWLSLENKRYDARLITFYKAVHGLVAIPVPSYFEQPKWYTLHMHPLSFRQTWSMEIDEGSDQKLDI